MEIRLEKHPQRGLEATLTGDDGRTVIWSMAAMSRNIRDYELEFREVNAYWEAVSPERRQQIFDVYAHIAEHIDEVYDVRQLQGALMEYVTQLMDLHPQHELEAFLPRCRITYPRSVKDSGEVQFSATKTYTVEKYERLLTLALAIRFLTPIWAVYVTHVSKYTGKNYKEIMALKLISKSWLASYQGFEELQAYVHANIKEDESSLSSVIGGVGSEMIPEWLLALVCVRRLATKELSGDGENNNLVSNIHSMVTHNLRGKDKTFNGFYKQKEARGDSDENISLLEEYKIKQSSTEGDKTIFSVYAQDVVRNAQQIDDTIDEKVVKAAWRANYKALDCSTTPGQMRLLQWVCGPILSPKSIRILNKPDKLKLMSVAQSILSHWGFPQLAAFMVAKVVDDGMQRLQVSENRARFPKELSNRIKELYPYVPQHIRPQKNVAIAAITRTVEDLSANDWLIEGPRDLIRAVDEYIVDGQYVTPGDIQRLLAELVIRIAHRNQ